MSATATLNPSFVPQKKRANRRINIHRQETSWKASVSVAVGFHLLIIIAGLFSKSQTILDLISQGETEAFVSTDTAYQKEQLIDLELVPPPPAESNPEFVKPEEVVKPKLVEAPKPKPVPVVQLPPSVAPAQFASQKPVVGNKNFPKPLYPYEAKFKKYQGTVVLAIEVVNGAVQNVSVASSSGYGILDSNGASWAKKRWNFAGLPSQTYTVPIQYKLAGI